MIGDAESTAQKQRGKPFKPGRSGNPNGRPKGSRNKLSEQFVAALCEDFEQHGADVLVAVRDKDPAAYLRVAASILPKQSQIEMQSDLSRMSDEQLKAKIAHLSAKLEGV